MTIDHASLSRRSTAPTPNRHLRHLSAHHAFSIDYVATVCLYSLLILSPSCFAVCGHHLTPRIAIVFSRLSSLPNSSKRQNSSSPLTHPVPPCIFHIPLLCEFYSIVVPHGHTASTSSSLLLVNILFLVGPGPLHEIAVSAFSRSPLGRADTFSFQYLPSTPRISLTASPLSPYFLALAFPFLLLFLLLLSCTGQTSLKTVPPLGLPLNPSIFQILWTTLSHHIPARPFMDYVIPSYSSSTFCYFLPYSYYQLWLETYFVAYSYFISTWRAWVRLTQNIHTTRRFGTNQVPGSRYAAYRPSHQGGIHTCIFLQYNGIVIFRSYLVRGHRPPPSTLGRSFTSSITTLPPPTPTAVVKSNIWKTDHDE